MKGFALLAVPAAAFVLLSAAPARAAGSSVSYRDLREAVVSVVGDFARSDKVRSGDAPAVRVKPVVNGSRLRPLPDRVEGMFRDALSVYRTVTVAADADPADLVLTPELRSDADGVYVVSAAVSDASTGRSVWTGSSRFGKPRAVTSAAVPAAAVPASAAPAAASSVPGASAAPAAASVPAPSVAPAAAVSVVGIPAPVSPPGFVEGAARTWDEWFDRGVESVGYRRDGAVDPARGGSLDSRRGFMGRGSFRFGAAYDFHSKHDFHDCHHGRGGHGLASGTADFRLNFGGGLDFACRGWYQQLMHDSEDAEAPLGIGKADDVDIDSYGADLRLQWSFAPGAVLNPYVGAGAEVSKTSVEAEVPYTYKETTRTWVPGHYERQPYYSYYGYTYYSTRWVPGHYKYSTKRRAGVRKVSESSSDVCWLLDAGLELNLSSRFSLRGDFAYFLGSSGDDGRWSDVDRKLASVEASLRLVQNLYLSVGGSYEFEEKNRCVNAGVGLVF